MSGPTEDVSELTYSVVLKRTINMFSGHLVSTRFLSGQISQKIVVREDARTIISRYPENLNIF